MSKTIEFKFLGPADLTDMMAIERQSEYGSVSASSMRDDVLAANNQAWGVVAGRHQKLVGFGIVSVVMDEAQVVCFSVDASYRRKGYGEKLLLFIIDKAKESKAETLSIQDRASNQKAIALYEKLYFEKIAVKANCYPVPGSEALEDGLVFVLKLL